MLDESKARLLSGGTGKIEVFEIDSLQSRQDGNNVDIDMELAKLTKNALKYQTFTQLLASKLGMYRSAISGRS